MLLAACSKVTYSIESPMNDPATGKPKVLQTFDGEAPGGDTFAVIVYYGAGNAPTLKSGGNSTALVDATASVGRTGLQLVQAALLPK
jgi:hypothetical protein